MVDPDHGGGSSGVMFNTGDLGRMLPDGSLEHFGRVDDQVKVKVRAFIFAAGHDRPMKYGPDIAICQSGFPRRARRCDGGAVVCSWS